MPSCFHFFKIHFSTNGIVGLLGGLFLLVIVGCKADLYTVLEPEANEMVTILLRSGIDSERVPAKEGLWVVRADKSEYARAVTVLKDNGYPKMTFNNIGEVFKKQGLVTSPLEDRIRLIYALSQELSQTLSYIDGVLKARVHVVLPENNPNTYVDVVKPSSAAVFIKYREDEDISGRIPQIKELVVNSIEGLLYEKVTVALFPSKVKDEGPEHGLEGPIMIKAKKLFLLCTILGGLLTLMLGISIFLYTKSGWTITSLAKEFKERNGK